MAEWDTRPADGEAELREGAQAPGEEEPAARVDRPQEAGASPEVVAEALEAEVRRYKAEAEQHWQQFLHAAADLDNYKKQALRARDEAVERTRRMMMTVILSVVDNIERALDYGTQSPDSAGERVGSIIEGIQITHRQILDLLANMGVHPFNAAGRPFDPRYHEAVEVVPPTDDHAAGTVVAEIQRGYLVGDEVLRPARVRVAREQ